MGKIKLQFDLEKFFCYFFKNLQKFFEKPPKTYKLNDPEGFSKNIIESLRNNRDLERLSENSLKIAKQYDLLSAAKPYISYFTEVQNKFYQFTIIFRYLNELLSKS